MNPPDRRGDADGGQEDRQEERVELNAGFRTERRERGNPQCGGRKDRAAVRFIKVGAHTGDVADVVADVVGDRGGIPLVVFRNSGFDFTDQVGPDIRRFGVDTAADAREERLGRGTHTEAEHHDRDFGQAHRPVQMGEDPIESAEPENNVKKTEPDNRQPHDRARTERDLKTLVERVLGACRRAARSPGSGFHAAPAGQTREETAREERPGDDLVLNAQAPGQKHQERPDHDEEDSDHLVLLLQIGVGPFTDSGGDRLHFVVPLIGLHHRFEEFVGIEKGGESSGQRQEPVKAVKAEETQTGIAGIGLIVGSAGRGIAFGGGSRCLFGGCRCGFVSGGSGGIGLSVGGNFCSRCGFGSGPVLRTQGGKRETAGQSQHANRPAERFGKTRFHHK